MTFVVTKIINENSEALKQSKAANISQFSKIKLPCSGLYRGAGQQQSLVNLLMQVHIFTILTNVTWGNG